VVESSDILVENLPYPLGEGRLQENLEFFYCLICRYCYKIPENYPSHLAAPLLCAGITVYSPMIRHNMKQPGKSLGVIGLGGLGHMAVLFGKAFGLKVTVFSTSISKKEEALTVLGADNFVLSSDEQQMKVYQTFNKTEKLLCPCKSWTSWLMSSELKISSSGP